MRQTCHQICGHTVTVCAVNDKRPHQALLKGEQTFVPLKTAPVHPAEIFPTLQEGEKNASHAAYNGGIKPHTMRMLAQQREVFHLGEDGTAYTNATFME